MADRDRPSGPDDASGAPPRDEPLEHRLWVAQADELARLRDEVRAAAEREALDVVATARRRIRQVITEARRDLLVLTAQLHATLGPGASPQQPGALPEGSIEVGDAERQAAVQAALDRAKAGIEALAHELEQVPADVPPPAPPVHQPSQRRAAEPETAPAPAITDDASVRGVPWRPHAELTPHEGAPPSPRAAPWRYAAAALAVLILLATGLVWFSRTRTQPVDSPEQTIVDPGSARDAASDVAASAPVVPESTEASAPPADPEELSIVLAMQRPAWIRTIVDGRRQERTYEAGDTLRIDGARDVFLRVGDAGAVSISVNGSPAELLGRDGTVVEREFSLEDEAPVAADPPARASAPGRETSPAGSADLTRGTAPAAPPATPPAEARGTPRSEPAAADPPEPPQTLPRAGTPPPATPPSLPAPGPRPPDSAAAADPLAPAAEGGDINVAIAGQQWLDHYHRQDARAMAALTSDSATIADERQPDERFPAGTPGVERRIDAVSVEFAGDIAIYTARMTERRADSGATQQHLSRVAQIWSREEGRWQLTDVRIMSEASVGQLVR